MIRRLTCCVCGDPAGRFEQHWNRDTGYGICGPCAVQQSRANTPQEIQNLYGAAGINYPAAPTPTEKRNAL